MQQTSPTIGSMETLPTEVALPVLRHLEKVDLKAFRMVNRRMCELSSRLLFNKVYASVHRKDIQVLHQISLHPALRLFVNEVIYNGVFFSCSFQGFQETPRGASDADVDYYRQRLAEQEVTLRGNSTNINEISSALRRMPNVERIVLTNHWKLGSHSPGPLNTSNAGEQWSSGPLSREYPRYIPPPNSDPLRLSVQGSSRLHFDYGFMVMCKAAAAAKTKIRELVVEYLDVPHGNDFTLGISSNTLNIPNADLEQYAKAFRHLRRLSFRFDGTQNTEERAIARRGGFARLLARAPCLKELTLDFDVVLYDLIERQRAIVPVPLDAYVGVHCWPRLHFLKLCYMACSEVELSELIQRHCNSLRVLHLEHVTLTEGMWQEAAGKWHKCLRLDGIKCQSLDDRPDESVVPQCKELERYIMSGESGPIYYTRGVNQVQTNGGI